MLKSMVRIDALYLEDPCSGSRRMVGYLALDGIPISRERARNLQRRTGLRPIYQKPRTTISGALSERFPCLMDVRTVIAVDQAWATGITYIPLQKGVLYLMTIVGLFSRHVLSCRLRRSGSAGQPESVATTTSWWRGCGQRSSMRRCTCTPTAMAGRQNSP
jgi:putative transposase